MSELGPLAEEHVRAALQRAEADFPPFAVDSWSDPAVAGQWVVIEDDEGRRSQARIEHTITRGVGIERGSVAGPCWALAKAMVAELRAFVAGGGLIISRPYPEPGREGVHVAHVEFRGLWLRLVVGASAEGMTAVLAAQMGKGPTPLAEPEEKVVWL